jgi:hypothetical protein
MIINFLCKKNSAYLMRNVYLGLCSDNIQNIDISPKQNIRNMQGFRLHWVVFVKIGQGSGL